MNRQTRPSELTGAAIAGGYQNEVRRRAWALMRSVYKYPAIPFASIGPACMRWCIDRAAWDIKHGTAAERFEREAAALAEKHGYDISALNYQMMRYSAGSLSTTLDAKRHADLFAHAMNLAARHEPVAMLQAAE